MSNVGKSKLMRITGAIDSQWGPEQLVVWRGQLVKMMRIEPVEIMFKGEKRSMVYDGKSAFDVANFLFCRLWGAQGQRHLLNLCYEYNTP